MYRTVSNSNSYIFYEHISSLAAYSTYFLFEQVYKGADNTSPSLWNVTETPVDIYEATGQLFVEFKSVDAANGRGYFAQYSMGEH